MSYNDQNPLPGGITWGDVLPPDSPPSPAPPQKRPKRGGIGWGEILGALGNVAEAAGDLFGSKASPRAPKNVRIERYQPTMVNIPEVPIRPVQWELPTNNRNQAKQNIGQKALQQQNNHDEKKELLHRITQSTRAKNYLHALNNGQGPLYEAMYGKPDMSALEINTPAPSIEAIVSPKSASPSWVPDERFDAPKRMMHKPMQGRLQQTATSPQELFPPSNTGTRPNNESGALYEYAAHTNVGSGNYLLSATFVKDAQEIHQLAEKLKEDHYDDVDVMQMLMQRAISKVGNNSEQFIRLLNETVLGSDTKVLMLIPLRFNVRVNIGDVGMNPIYQDHSKMQMYHFWSYVNFGYYWPTDMAKAINWEHEVVSEIRVFTHGFNSGNAADLRLGAIGINIGRALKHGHLKPRDVAKKLDDILRTPRYNVLSDSNIWWQGLKAKEKP